jgi:hypothetical protein
MSEPVSHETGVQEEEAGEEQLAWSYDIEEPCPTDPPS